MSLAIIPRRGHIAGDLQRDGHPALYLVPSLDESDEPRDHFPAPEHTVRASHGRRPIRLTRRGRIVVGLVLLSLVIAVMALLAPASQAAAPAGPTRTVVVHHGDTLWSITGRAMSGADPYASVERVRRLNHMDDYTVYVGQQLILPPAS